MAAGRLTDRITVRRKTQVSNGRGGYTTVWADVGANIPAEVISQGGRESLLASALQGVSSFKISIRRRDDIEPADQILFGSYELNIRSAAPAFDDRRDTTVIFADTESPQGA